MDKEGKARVWLGTVPEPGLLAPVRSSCGGRGLGGDGGRL